ncbi:hypothetical protein DMN91_001421 [Ooceraea biroi]|uniref:MI domain-containing protein n=1 Tax=Ooceraea biroi TaxID=2015173 RepID=A0A3L8E4M3_OOCBI|nr:hypothetical protein DMN91_001421 [Ooceraea biroi]
MRELLRKNIVRGRGLLARSIIQAQAASPTFTPVYAALIAIINSKFPHIGELVLKHLILLFKRGFKRNDKLLCISAATFIAHLVNQRVTYEIIVSDANKPHNSGDLDSVTGNTDGRFILNVFKFEADYLANEEKYKELSKEILGSDDSNSEGDYKDGEEESSEEDSGTEQAEGKAAVITDDTETNLTALRRTIYLTIHSSLDFEECAHKLMKMQLKPGQEIELCHMFLDCCAEMRTYEKFFGLLAGRFCAINKIYVTPFEQIFKDSYHTIHRLDTNKLRNVSKFFAHLLFKDSISWNVLSCIKLNEEDTTSSNRIFIKILFQELSEYMGLAKLNERLKDVTLQEAFEGLFPRDDPKNTRFIYCFIKLTKIY